MTGLHTKDYVLRGPQAPEMLLCHTLCCYVTHCVVTGAAAVTLLDTTHRQTNSSSLQLVYGNHDNNI